MERPNHKTNFWPYFAAAAVIMMMLVALRWSLAHPYGTSWDEAEYINQVVIDAQRLETGRLLTLGGRILIKSWGRPPAYRLFALPVIALFGFHTVTARLASLACFGATSLFIYLATRRFSGQVASAFAVLVFALSPIVVSASSWLSTEGPLYLATSAMLYYLFVYWTDRSEGYANWIGLGLAVGIGFLSKASFVLVALPVLGLWLVIGRWMPQGFPTLVSQRKAALLAFLVAAPWWLLNIRPAVAEAHMARNFVQNSLGPPSPATWLRWADTVAQSLLGPGLSILVLLVMLAWLQKAIIKRDAILDPLRRVALGACACAGFPIVLAQLTGTNHLLRHISPAVIPLAIAVGILAETVGWIGSRIAIAISSVLFVGQALLIAFPIFFPNTRPVNPGFANGALPWRIMARRDQWNWMPVQDISRRCGIAAPRITYLGGGVAFDPPHIEYPFVLNGASTRQRPIYFPEVKWLWRPEEGPIKWPKVMDAVEQSDIVLTEPHYVRGEERWDDADNEHNSELAERLSQDLRFRGPIYIKMGRFQPVEVAVFLKKTLECPSVPVASNVQ